MSHSPNVGRAVILGLLGIAAIAAVAAYVGNRHRRLPPQEGAADRQRDIREAFVNPPPQGEDPEQFQTFLGQLGKDLRRGDAAALGEAFDFERMYDECDREGVLSRLGGRQKAMVPGLRAGVLTQFGRPEANLLQWDRTEVKRVRWLVPAREAVVVARHTEDEDPTLWIKMRWWLRWDGARWKVYDLEDLQAGMRMSLAVGSIAVEMGARKPGMAEIGAMRRAIEGVKEALPAIAAGEFEKAETALQRIGPISLPQVLQAYRQLLWGMVHLGKNEMAKGLEDIDRAEQLNPDMPIVYYLRAKAYSALEQHEQAIEQTRKYIDALGPDGEAYLTMGQAYEALDRHADAADCFRKALDDTPELEEALTGLRPKLDVRDTAELGERLRKMRDPAAHFDRLFHDALSHGDLVAAVALCDGLAQVQPDSVAVTSARVRLHVRVGRIDEAAALFRASLTKVTDPKDRDRVRLDYFYAMAGEGHGLDAYRAVPNTDAAAAFRTLADNLLDFDLDPDERPAGREPEEELRGLIDAHRQRQPADPWLHFYTGQLHMQAKDYDAAEKEFAAGMAKPLDEESQNRFRWTRVWARFQAGRGLSAYGEIGPSDKTFRQLAGLFNNPEHVDHLNELIEAHRKTTPIDRTLPIWEGQAHWLRKEYERAVAQYRRDAPPPNEKDDEERFEEGLPWDWEQNLVRSLIRLKRFDEARHELERPTLKHYTILRAAVAAAAGDVTGTDQELAGIAKERFLSPASLYADPDLGPALRSDKFAPLRQKYPEPKKDEPVEKL
jgi:tetratricopeptide (TPR) repeat protein